MGADERLVAEGFIRRVRVIQGAGNELFENVEPTEAADEEGYNRGSSDVTLSKPLIPEWLGAFNQRIPVSPNRHVSTTTLNITLPG